MKLLPVLVAWLAATSFAGEAKEKAKEAKPDAKPPAAAPEKPAEQSQVQCITCDAEGTLTYHLCLPTTFDAAKRYPVLYGFSASDNDGELSAKRWAPLANQFGWVIAWCDRGVTDTPKAADLKPIWDAVTASVEKKVRVHPRRSYAAGYGGGAKAAVALARSYPAKFAGVFADGAFDPGTPADHPKHVAVFATTTRMNPAARELMKASADCQERGIPFRLQPFDARSPEPAPARVLEEGVKWMSKLWFVHQDDDSPEARKERLAAAKEAFDAIRKLLAADNRPAAYDKTLEFRDTFQNTTDTALKALVAEAAALVAEMEKDPAVAGMKLYKPPVPADVVAAFLKAVEADPKVTDQARAAVKRLLDEAKGDPAELPDALAGAVAALHPKLGEALAALNNDDTRKAIALLTEQQKSPDPYLAAHAAYFEGRALVIEERYEEALPLLSKVAGEWLDRTLYGGESLFLVGICQAELIRREAALRVFRDFLKLYADAPERMRIGADLVVRTIQALEEGSLDDVQDRMDESRRRLHIEKSGKPTQERQERIIAMLDKLIREAEDREQQGGGGGGGGGGGQGGQGGGPPSGNQQPSGPASQSSAAAGEGRMGALARAARGRADESWGNARARERQEVLNVLKAKFPERYRELLEQYYKSLQEGER
ncbi:MAG TPA: hypothetical protein VNE39_27290 [Planctomycetota bacterium]|nr:hypothetical protein [Planctomycetota bacterium]